MDILIRQDAVERIYEEKPVNQTDSGCETSTTKSIEEILTTTTVTTTAIKTENNVSKRGPGASRRLVNKTAYAKLHRSLSPGGQLDSIKSKYETSENESVKSDTDSPKLRRTPPIKLELDAELAKQNSKLPVPKTRSSVKSAIIVPTEKTNDNSKYRHSLILDRKSKKKDENSNEVFRKNSSSSGEFRVIIPRSESVETVDKLEKELDLFIMDKKPKEKKRVNSFRKIFSGRIFSKEKKKKEETESIQQKKNVNNDNIQNENNAFSRQCSQRHSLGTTNIPKPKRIPQIQETKIPPLTINIEEIEKKYAEMRVKEFDNIKQNFENPNSPRDPDKQIPTVNPGPMDLKKVANINKFIDTSSSASTMESDRENSSRNHSVEADNSYKSIRFVENQRNTPPRAQELRQIQDVRLVNPKALIPINSERPLPNPYQNSATSKPTVSPKPQIAQEIVSSSPKPKNYMQFNFNEQEDKLSLPSLNETYGTVFDSLESKREFPAGNYAVNVAQKPPRSPSLEATKLRLPLNRDLGPMSPRMRSPIPQHHVSTEKLIATELLRGSRSPTPTKKKTHQLNASHQKLEMNIDYPDNVSVQRNETVGIHHVITSKPPISRIPEHVNVQRNHQLLQNYDNRSQISLSTDFQEKLPSPRTSEYVNIQRNSQLSPNYEKRQQLTTFAGSQEKLQRSNQPAPPFENRNQYIDSQERLPRSRTPEHINMPRSSQLSPIYDDRNSVVSQERLVNSNMRSPTPNSLLQSLDLSSIRPQSSRSSTPVEMRIAQLAKQSPQKEDMRRSVEAYYWKEIKKLKEQENRDLYYYQVKMMPFGYAEDPVSFRRSRSSSPSQRNGRRSLSLPREPKSQMQLAEVDTYGRFQPTPIPEGRAVVNYANYYHQTFNRNAPERRTIEAVPRTEGNSLYRPIFKRGSLTTPSREFVEDQQYKRVSFGHGQKEEVRPIRNGYNQKPPQRKESLDDDVFLPNPQQTSKLIVDGKEIYGYTNRPYDNQYMMQPDSPYYQNANFYRRIHQEPVYSSRVKENVRIEDSSRIPVHLTRHNSIQLVDPTYGQQQRVSRRMSFDNSQTYIPKPPRRQIYIKDDVYGYLGGYAPNDQPNVVYSSRQSIAEPIYGYTRGVPRQVTVKDKVCDMYGQIHERGSPSLSVRKAGVMLGQLQPVQNPSYSPMPNQNFVRNSRLTSSANDVYKRYQNVDPRYFNNVIYDGYPEQNDAAPSRPLPPVPTDKKVYFRQNNNVAEMSDAQKPSSGVRSNKKRAIFGNIIQPSLQYADEDNANAHCTNLQRLILLEQLQLIRHQKDLEIHKREWQTTKNSKRIDDQYRILTELRLLQLETINTKDLTLSDLRKRVLIEELQLVKLKISLALDDMN